MQTSYAKLNFRYAKKEFPFIRNNDFVDISK